MVLGHGIGLVARELEHSGFAYRPWLVAGCAVVGKSAVFPVAVFRNRLGFGAGIRAPALLHGRLIDVHDVAGLLAAGEHLVARELFVGRCLGKIRETRGRRAFVVHGLPHDDAGMVAVIAYHGPQVAHGVVHEICIGKTVELPADKACLHRDAELVARV